MTLVRKRQRGHIKNESSVRDFKIGLRFCDKVMHNEENVMGDVMNVLSNDEEDVMDIEENIESDNEEDVVEELKDSDYDSETSSISEDRRERILDQAEINTLNEFTTKYCAIYFYYSTGDSGRYCTSCFLRITDLFSYIYAVRVHETQWYSLILGLSCSECRASLHQILPCNLCPMCTVS